jgi:hypothetical protein
VNDWPPHPSVILGAGRWRRIIEVLERGTKVDRAIAATIRRDIEETAGRIAAMRAERGEEG